MKTFHRTTGLAKLLKRISLRNAYGMEFAFFFFFFSIIEPIHDHCSINVKMYKALSNMGAKHSLNISLKYISSQNISSHILKQVLWFSCILFIYLF